MRKIIKGWFLLPLLTIFAVSTIAFAEPVTLEMAQEVADTCLTAQNKIKDLALQKEGKQFLEQRSISTPQISELQEDKTGNMLAYVFGLKPKGFIVVSPDTDITPVLAYSFEGDFPLEDFKDNVLLHMVTWDMENRLKAIPIVSDELKEKNNELWDKYLSAEDSFLGGLVRATMYGPYLITYWDQNSPYNYYCPYDPYYYWYGYGALYQCPVGCVATAMAQIINYHQHPSSVTFTSNDNYAYWYIENVLYFWFSELPPYFDPASASISNISYPASTDMAARLSYACGVSVKMAYKEDGSSTSHKPAASAYKDKFGYVSATAYATSTYWASYWDTPYASNFYSKLRGNMQNAQPAMLSIFKAGNLGGHSIVCDGYKSTTGQYHLNYGWGVGSPDPTPSSWWYTLPSGMPDGYSVVSDGVLDINPTPTPGSNDYCRDYGPCSEGEGDCDSNSECESGLTCVNDVGAKYGWRSIVDVCESTSGGTPGSNDYCRDYGPCSEGEGDCDSNSECESGLTCVNDVGAKYGWRSIVDVCESTSGGTPGSNDYCRDYGPCSEGEGDCDSNSECESGLTCVNDVGAKYGWRSIVDVCEWREEDIY